MRVLLLLFALFFFGCSTHVVPAAFQECNAVISFKNNPNKLNSIPADLVPFRSILSIDDEDYIYLGLVDELDKNFPSFICPRNSTETKYFYMSYFVDVRSNETQYFPRVFFGKIVFKDTLHCYLEEERNLRIYDICTSDK